MIGDCVLPQTTGARPSSFAGEVRPGWKSQSPMRAANRPAPPSRPAGLSRGQQGMAGIGREWSGPRRLPQVVADGVAGAAARRRRLPVLHPGTYCTRPGPSVAPHDIWDTGGAGRLGAGVAGHLARCGGLDRVAEGVCTVAPAVQYQRPPRGRPLRLLMEEGTLRRQVPGSAGGERSQRRETTWRRPAAHHRAAPQPRAHQV